jgi:hypothetical protein
MDKLNNLLGFDDFDKNWSAKQQKSTKRTEVGLDILNESWTSKNPQGRFSEFVDAILEDIDKALKMNNVKDMKIFLSATHNMIINDSKYVFNEDPLRGGVEPAKPVAGRYYNTSMPKRYRGRELAESKRYNEEFNWPWKKKTPPQPPVQREKTPEEIEQYRIWKENRDKKKLEFSDKFEEIYNKIKENPSFIKNCGQARRSDSTAYYKILTKEADEISIDYIMDEQGDNYGYAVKIDNNEEDYNYDTPEDKRYLKMVYELQDIVSNSGYDDLGDQIRFR